MKHLSASNEAKTKMKKIERELNGTPHREFSVLTSTMQTFVQLKMCLQSNFK